MSGLTDLSTGRVTGVGHGLDKREQGPGIGRRDLVDFRLEIRGEVLGYLNEMRQEGVYTVTSKHSDMEQGGERKGTRSIK